MKRSFDRAEDAILALVQPDSYLPVQYLESLRRKYPIEPEKRLMWMILDDAVSCFQKFSLCRDKKETQEFLEVEQWFLDVEYDWVFSFENICACLDLSSSYLRTGLARWKKSMSAGEWNLPVRRGRPRAAANRPGRARADRKPWNRLKAAGS